MKLFLILACLFLPFVFSSFLTPTNQEKGTHREGLLRWKRDGVINSPIIEENSIENGINWKVSISPNSWGEPEIILDGKSNVLIVDGYLVQAISFTHDGNLNWNVTFDQLPQKESECLSSSSVLGGNDILYYLTMCTPSGSNQINVLALYSIDSINGTLIQLSEILRNDVNELYIDSNAVLDSKNNVYFIYQITTNETFSLYFCGINYQGKVLVNVSLPFRINTFDITIANDIIYASDEGSNLYSIDLQGNIINNISLFSDPQDGWYGQYNSVTTGSSGIIYLSGYTLLSVNPDFSLRYFTTNYSTNLGDLSLDESHDRIYVGFREEYDFLNGSSNYWGQWAAYEPEYGHMIWNYTTFLASDDIIDNYDIFPAVVREIDGIGLYAQNNQFFALDSNGKWIWSLSIGSIEAGQISTPLLDDINKSFFVKIVFFDHWEIWSVQQPPIQNNEEIISEISMKNIEWQQCGSTCNSYGDCEGYSCSKCKNGTCQPGDDPGSPCNYRGDCDERVSTCLDGQCSTLSPGCGDPCDYFATCGSEPDCYYCYASEPGYCTSG